MREVIHSEQAALFEGVRAHALREPKFVLDVHLGKLAAYLRMFGFDAFYRSFHSGRELVRTALEECRILLTRDRGGIYYQFRQCPMRPRVLEGIALQAHAALD